MNLVEIEKTVANLQQQLFRNSNSFSVGILKSSFKGSGLQFKEHQVYNHGDDVRFIDWKLSARSSQTYVKTFEEERNVEINIVFDLTPTMLLGYRGKTKFQACMEIIGLLYLLAGKTNDLVSVHIWGEQREHVVPLKSGKEGIIQFLALMQKWNIINNDMMFNQNYSIVPIHKNDDRIKKLKALIARKKEVIFLSDFHYFETFKDFNKLLAHRNLHCFRVVCGLDEAKKLPMAFKAKLIGEDASQQFISGDTLAGHDLPMTRWKRISVEERYLEKFIKELM